MSIFVMLTGAAATYSPWCHIVYLGHYRLPKLNYIAARKCARKARKPPRLQKFGLAHRLDAVRLRLRSYGNLE